MQLSQSLWLNSKQQWMRKIQLLLNPRDVKESLISLKDLSELWEVNKRSGVNPLSI
jgi:hypothetical protein